ncbi:MAG: Spermidine/putrescine import ATP-binding protein PotA [Candidatus Accumulibacter regalis]|uniref:Spermidine/putrescine import ATP-binding protein PotA n=1 Tax=Accumulibacter regalis TaxID=522306 RepID=A0A011NUC4_ACCRE|nr:polyamine ABC transporter ATP-binding protein [Accumulibacter sp.]EXI86338.1 MAG: Spermidine/putrescine import ATP-binding protein PotA [Candidatus Accumulibacter regalis]HRE70281.1 polyamine ABC transporter ATP-binding protein [Accumulibacter sp.]HRE86074.1 polyamine ABC transporter ATP-binding protein [Accumulibacter sp.]HRI92099.1 polyamine ABC transporter ATP-binding protein [Accumulibacter sp.]
MASSSALESAGPGRPWNDPAAEPYIRIERVSKSFADFVAVDDVSLNIYRSELFCLLGGSGCGKTTLLRMLAGFEEPSSGKIFIDGLDMSGIPPYERPVNMMFQSYALFPHMTVDQNVGFGLQMENRSRSEIADRVAHMLKLVRLSEFGKRKPDQLSGGQRQRVALARALIKQPKLLLLDEPLGALDRKLREHTQFELVNLQEDLGVTFVVVTHDQEEAMTLSSRIGVMDHGKIVQVGTPQEIYESPRSRFVAEFVGSVNLFAGQLTASEPDRLRITCPELEQPVHVDVDESSVAAPLTALWVAIRPEKIQLSVQPPQAAANWTRGLVKEIAYQGNLSVLLIRLPSGKTVRVTRPNVWRHEEESITWEQEVYLHWHASSPLVVSA